MLHSQQLNMPVQIAMTAQRVSLLKADSRYFRGIRLAMEDARTAISSALA